MPMMSWKNLNKYKKTLRGGVVVGKRWSKYTRAVSTHLIYPLIDKFNQLSTAVVKQIDVYLKKTPTFTNKTRINHIKTRTNHIKFRKNDIKLGKNEVIRRLLVLDSYEVSPIHDCFFYL